MSIKSNIALMAGMAALFDSQPSTSKERPAKSKGIVVPDKQYKKRQARKKMQKQSRKTNRKK